jgi:hypothetical protein
MLDFEYTVRIILISMNLKTQLENNFTNKYLSARQI